MITAGSGKALSGKEQEEERPVWILSVVEVKSMTLSGWVGVSNILHRFPLILTLSCVNLGKLHLLFDPYFPLLQNGIIIMYNFTELL